MNRKLSILLLPLLTLTSCGSESANYDAESNLNEFLEIFDSLSSQNYTITMEEDIYEYLGEDIINTKFKGVPYQGGYIRKEDVGIFDYVLVNDEVEIQGMISLNTEISPLDLISNPEYLFRINKSKWSGVAGPNKSVKLNYLSLTNQEKSFVSWSFGIESNIKNTSSIKTVTASFNDKCKFTVEYIDKTSGRTGTKSFEVDKINQTVNTPITNYLENGSFEKKTDWTNFQKSFLNQYELSDLDFLDAFTIGLSVDFSYLSLGGLVVAYDLYGSKTQVDNIVDELYDLGYEITDTSNDIILAICKVVNGEGKTTHAKKIEFKYVPYSELSYGEKVTCPNGYTQLVYSHTIYYEPTDLAGVNEVLSNNDIPTLEDHTMIESVSMSDLTELTNAEWKIAIEENNIEEGIEEEVLDVLDASYVIHIFPKSGTKLKEVVNVYCKAYLAKLVSSGYINVTEAFNSFLNIKTPVEDEVPYDKNNYGNKAIVDTVNDRIKYVEISSYDYSYSGYIEVIVEIYTRYGAEKIFGE